VAWHLASIYRNTFFLSNQLTHILLKGHLVHSSLSVEFISHLMMFYSYSKPMNNAFSHNFSAKRTLREF